MSRLSESDLQQFRQNMVKGTHPLKAINTMLKKPYGMYRSKLEASWAGYLNGLVMLKAIRSVHYEPLNLRLPGEKNFYKPDFLTVGDFGLTFYEVKGRNKSDDRSLVKIKTAAGITPWAKFVLVKRIHGQWEERTIT